MRTLFTSLIILLVATTTNAQIAYYDAKLLHEHGDPDFSEITKKVSISINSENFSKIVNTLLPYLDDVDNEIKESTASKVRALLTEMSSLKESMLLEEDEKEKIKSLKDDYSLKATEVIDILKKEFKDNSFVGISGSFQSNEIDARKGVVATTVSHAIGGLAGLDVTTIVQGLSQFMIDRAKQELTVAFFNRFKKFVDKNREIQVLFPKTTDVLNNLLGYNYPEMLPVLRTSFHEDLNALPYHLDDILELPKYRALLEELPEVRVAIKSIRLIHDLQLGEKHPADIINSFATLEEWNDTTASAELRNMGNAIALGSIISNSLRYTKNVTSTNVGKSYNDTTVSFNHGIFNNNSVYSKKDTIVRIFKDTSRTPHVFYHEEGTITKNKEILEIPEGLETRGLVVDSVFLNMQLVSTKLEITNTKIENTYWVVKNNETFETTELSIETQMNWLDRDGQPLLTDGKHESSASTQKISGVGTRAWISLGQLEELTKNKIAFRVFLGLLYQKVKNFDNDGVHFKVEGRTIPFTEVMKENKDELFLFQNQLTEFIELGERVEKAKEDIIAIRNSDNKPSNDQLFEYINTSIDVIEYSFGIASLLDGNIEIDNYVGLARKGNELFKHIYKKEYASAINDGVDILETTIGIIEKNSFRKISDPDVETALSDLPGVKKKNQAKILNSLKKESFEKIKTTNSTQRSIDEVRKELASSGLTPGQKEELTSAITHIRLAWLKELLPKISKYGTFMANMVEAESPEEVKSILENVVLPVGSSSIKKNAKFNIAVQSYLGAYWAPSGLGNNPTDETMAWSQPFGVTAPIGVSFSKGLKKKRGSFSLFVSLFDIGAIVDYDLKTDSISTSSSTTTVETSKEYKIELGQIFSPGAYLVYGFGANLPLSFSVGGQYGPGIFNISNSTGVQINQNPYWRWSMTITVDIPLFNLHHKPKEFRTFKN